MSHCPSCGRYIGPYQACPYCGARQAGRISIRAVKVAAILLATVGLAALWFAATRAPVPLVHIGQAGATTNMAYVRLQGRCTRAPSYDPQAETLGFWIEDGTGEMHVSTYRAQTRQIIAQGRLPALGDQVEVAGTLRIREDLISLTVNVPEQLEIARATPVERAIGSISPKDQYLRVRVRGQVRSIYEPYSGLKLVTVRDESGSIPVALTQDLVALSATSPTLSIGQPVEVVAAVSLYRDEVQLVPASAGDVAPCGQQVAAARECPIGELSHVGVGRLASVRGAVTRVDPFSAGVKVTLDDATGTVILLLWQPVYDALPEPAALEAGAQVQAQGEVSRYRGELELVPELASDVQVLALAAQPARPAASGPTPTPPPPHTPTPSPTQSIRVHPRSSASPTPTPAVELTRIEAIPAHVGEQVTVEGTVVGAASFSNGFKFTLDDGTGQVVLLMWHEVYDDCWDAPAINLGARVRAAGQAGQYEGEWQIEPDFGGDVKAITAFVAPTPRQISSLSSGDEGQRVLIEGQVIRVEGLESAVKVFVGDGTGEVLVFLWRTVLDRVRDNVALGTPGSRVRVAGTVEIYRGNLEIVPVLPNDIAVLETASPP